MLGEKSEKKILKKEIQKQLRETHEHIVELTLKQAKENQDIMIEKVKELEQIIKTTIKEEIECQIKIQKKKIG